MNDNKDLVLVTGAFDVMHLGHIKLLQYAASFGKVWVAIDFDEKIKATKGPTRPFNCFSDRKKFLESIIYVDRVVGFGSKEELENLCKAIKPNYRIVGMDWMGKEIVGEKHCKHLRYFDRIPSYSTTRILNEEK